MKIGNLDLQEHRDIRAAMCLIGPREATELLKRNTHNRKASKLAAWKYAKEMLHGEWLPTAAGIGIDSNGVLTDGQTRLMAVIESNETVNMLVVSGLPPASQAKQDRHNKRALCSALFLSGMTATEDRYGVQIACVLARRTGEQNGDSHVADCEVKDAYEAHKTSIMWANGAIKNNEQGTGQAGVRAAMCLAYELHKEKADQFVKLLQSELQSRADHPAFRLRKVLTGETGQTRRTGNVGFGGGQQNWSFERTLYAFNAFCEGRYITCVLSATDVTKTEREYEQ